MVQIIGLKNVTISEGSCISDNVWLNVCIRDEKIRMKIGKCVLIGRQSMISTGGYMEIGDFCIFAPRVYVSDADHVFDDVYQPILQQGATLERSIIVEENCWFGINTVITGNITVGRCSIVAANSVVKSDVPPFCVVAGIPARIIKMYNPGTKKWEAVRNEDDISKAIKIRGEIKLPDREEYKSIISKNSTMSQVYPIVAGRGECV
ncbi:MAG: acyltransferase [Ruminiclostridium sp.]|nr:acyltransferase [Ruminiclostridium sp.]